MAEWLIERGIGEDRALRVEAGKVLAAKARWPGEPYAGQRVEAKLISRRAGSSRGTAQSDRGEQILVDRLPKDATEGSRISLTFTRAALAERGRLKRATGRCGTVPATDDVFATGRPVRRFPAGLWEEVWGAAWERSVAFPGGAVLFDVTPGMTVVDIDGELAPRELALAAIPAIARAVRWFELGGSIAIDFPTLTERRDRQAVDAALGDALVGWRHERTAMNGFGLVQLVARLEGPSLLHRLSLRPAPAAARLLLRQAEMLEGAGAILLTAHPVVLGAIEPGWQAEFERRQGRPVRVAADPALAIDGGHAQIVRP